MDKNFFIKQLDEILDDYYEWQSYQLDFHVEGEIDDTNTFIGNTLTKAKSAIVRITGNNSEYYKNIGTVYDYSGLQRLIGVVEALKSDLEKDYLKSLGEIVQAEVFSNYLEMASHLLEQGYKDPAAVLIGSTLEAHLRELCISNGIDIETTNGKGDKIPKKANSLNDELARAGVLTVPKQKQVTAWLDLRNKAAHGEYEKYTKEEISLMLQGVNLLMTFK